MFKKVFISLAITLNSFFAFSQEFENIHLSRFLPEDFEINSINFSSDGDTGFFTAYVDWEKQIPYLISIDRDTLVQQIMDLDTIYNGAISPSGNQIIYCIRGGEYTTILLTKREKNGWTSPIDLTESSGITGGYFHWYSESELYFYTPDNNGDLVGGKLQNNKLTITNRFESINTTDTEFSPFMGPHKSYLIFTRYVEGDESQQGLMLSKNLGTIKNPQWSIPRKIKGLPYGWGAFVIDDQLYFSNGLYIYRSSFSF